PKLVPSGRIGFGATSSAGQSEWVDTPARTAAWAAGARPSEQNTTASTIKTLEILFISPSFDVHVVTVDGRGDRLLSICTGTGPARYRPVAAAAGGEQGPAVVEATRSGTGAALTGTMCTGRGTGEAAADRGPRFRHGFGSGMTAPPDGVGHLLRRYRLGAEVTQRELALRAGLSVRAVRNIEQNRVRTPHPRSVHRLAAALDLPDADRERLLAGVDAGG